MVKRNLLAWSFVIFLLCQSTTLFAKVWIVDNNPFPVGDFTTLSAAHSVAADGDTIYMYPSANAYAGIVVTKQLFIVGPGFNLNVYHGQASITPAVINSNMLFNAGSQGSVLEGLGGDFFVQINTDNITIKRNNLSRLEIGGSSCQILQNDIIGSINFGSSLRIIASNLGAIMIANNKIINTNFNENAVNGNPTSHLTLINNVISGHNSALINLSSSTIVQNNIITSGSITWGPVFQYNMSNSNQLPESHGNIINIDMSTVFEDHTNAVTGLHLKAGSLAIGTGFGGVDMGIYGGDAPYIDGGYPGIPAIYQLETEVVTTPQNGLDVVFKAKSNAQ